MKENMKMFELKNRKRTVKKMSEVPDQQIRWIWNPYLPFGKVSVIHGEPGIGKSIFAVRLIAACTNKKYLPGMGRLEPCNVLYLSADDDLSDMVKPRLMEAGADLERVFAIHDMLPFTLAEEGTLQLIMENDIRVLIVDPIQEYVEQDVYGDHPEMTYPIINKLAEIAQRTGCAVILIAYSDGLDGSRAWKANYAEKISSLLCIESVDGKKDRRQIIHEKSLLSVEGETLSFTLDDMEVSETGSELPW